MKRILAAIAIIALLSGCVGTCLDFVTEVNTLRWHYQDNQIWNREGTVPAFREAKNRDCTRMEEN